MSANVECLRMRARGWREWTACNRPAFRVLGRCMPAPHLSYDVIVPSIGTCDTHLVESISSPCWSLL